MEIVNFGIHRNKKDYSSLYPNSPFKLYAKYTYEDVCRLLCWEKGVVAQNIGGYKYDKTTETYPVFINYEKEAHIAPAIKFEDMVRDFSAKGKKTECLRCYHLGVNGAKALAEALKGNNTLTECLIYLSMK